MSLVVNNVSKIYQEGDEQVFALQQVSLTVEAGEFVAVIGPSGSGKSSFLSVVGALLQPTEGSIQINGKELMGLSKKEQATLRLHEIGFILQTSNLIPYLTVQEQLWLIKKMTGSLTEQDKQRADDLLLSLGLEKKRTKLPSELSGGERQRTAIARAFMQDPGVILADEPTASLDSTRAHEVVQLIAKEVKQRQKAAIMVTHDERMLTYCDKVYIMEDGKLTQKK